LELTEYVISASNNYLFYAVQRDLPESASPNVDVYELNLLTNSKRIIAKDVSGEATVIKPDRTCLYDMVLMGGEFRPAVISIESQERKVFDLEKEFSDVPYLSVDGTELVFYNPLTLASRNVKW
jgi:hypothetical protein